ncbi:DUF4082 domain-containing protein [Flavobacterium sp. Fl-318]|uniref:DUF4082 domain-containing protein n=1 Tax=Flavobacterium cupriresistens TaxID=2893885 RepID=A0ABU4RED6_9FLAO|nr:MULTISPECIES: DUF4082 domain-containing protein [unclassified Flavobacterium]MDX6190955.1 DUF4082 domain-containing protein [Flavobacterium sp. Fl-318]UFH43873.1 DUF4082 domain-containing protein [Flavobacterium sp. F-323]
MKTIKIFFTVLLAALFSVSCSSDNNKETVTNYEVENPLNSVVAQVGLKRYDYMNNPSEELGLVFTPTVKGNIKAITVKLPGASPGLRVTIWDFDSEYFRMQGRLLRKSLAYWCCFYLKKTSQV